MSKIREKKTVDSTLYTKEHAEEIMADFSQAASQIKSIEAEIEQEETAIKKKHQVKLEALKKVKKEAVDKLQIFADTNPEYFEKKKSLELLHGTIGFRTGTPKLKLLRNFNWDRVLEKLTEVLPQFVRKKDEVDKEGLLASRDDESIIEKFPWIGVCVDQEETFYVTSKEEDLQ